MCVVRFLLSVSISFFHHLPPVEINWNKRCFRMRFRTVRLHWARDKLGLMRYFFETCPRCRINLATYSPGVQRASTVLRMLPHSQVEECSLIKRLTAREWERERERMGESVTEEEKFILLFISPSSPPFSLSLFLSLSLSLCLSFSLSLTLVHNLDPCSYLHKYHR